MIKTFTDVDGDKMVVDTAAGNMVIGIYHARGTECAAAVCLDKRQALEMVEQIIAWGWAK